MTSPTDDGNGRVTMALLGAKLDSVIQRLDELCAGQSIIEGLVQEHAVTLTAHEGHLMTQCQRLDGRIDRVEDHVKIWQAGQGALSAILASIAAWLGMR